MKQNKKILGEDRRAFILRHLLDSNQPITGSDLAKQTNVSRQVIVQDISLLKAKNHPIIATAQGYIYIKKTNSTTQTKVIACRHSEADTEEELNIIVDHGVLVKNVIVEHQVYGEITASLMLQNRRDVELFMKKKKETNAQLLSALTEGIHLHTIEGANENILEDVCHALSQAGYLL
ncbi:hypothetical protein EV207_101229 [Scopulibacillus darangshiensis]|uniref:Transcriptional regulator n=1 Tax=Scopulibacillus darangshiensis TaxID=442528 RepID=A0A4R2PDR6_9BACL|nr:transcription repressor NadR [Scopulibacillus darangshiensis]TCP32251.1 hypothetical protein EV207_101229 [Scopulibacillus darangshiensis]